MNEIALDDLQSISDYLADVAGEDVAATYDAELKAACFSLADFPNRGRPRDELRSGLRSISVGRTMTIFYVVYPDEVQILHVIHSRRDIPTAFQDN